MKRRMLNVSNQTKLSRGFVCYIAKISKIQEINFSFRARLGVWCFCKGLKFVIMEKNDLQQKIGNRPQKRNIKS